ncbi:DUF3604 domain-containing protein [Hellea sp.]|nr:DUF3604 domain-containing protein [Hellea sp.]
MKRFLLIFLAFLGLIGIAYFILSNISRYPIDKTDAVLPPSSQKSQREHYAFGYQPRLTYTETRAACDAQYPNKRAMWGDLHIHTALSADAFPDGTRTFPDDVYRFAKGEVIDVPTPAGQPQRSRQLARPLDFAAVTDHAETFGEGYICRTPGAFPGYDSKACQTFRDGGDAGVRVFMTQNAKLEPARRESVCGEDLKDCLAADKIVWDKTIDWAQEAYDRSPQCSFTSFVGYEYTRAPNGMHMHRNTIFRNADVPERPATHQSHPLLHQLLPSFEQECRLGLENCDVISIPHNSNISGGNAFNPKEMKGFSMETQMAMRKYRNAYDRLMEITQHKGTSECVNEVSDILGDTDELCDVEALRAIGRKERVFDLNTYAVKFGTANSPECSDEHFDDTHNLYKGFCLSSRDFARGALLEGMAQEQSQGANPFEFGFIGSSDTHISVAGHVSEDNWGGHIAYETDLEGRLGTPQLGRFNRIVSNPGGLAGVYALENSRDAIFQSMKRREAFATSGPRIEPRFFVGHFDGNICGRSDWLDMAYAEGTPMGSSLPAQNTPFQILAQATADPLSQPLTQLQIIKGWIGDDGHKNTKVIDLQKTDGSDSLCRVFTDMDYNPTHPTYYYVRAVEPKRQRWSAAQCGALDEDKRPENCTNDQPEMIQEMAWSSPIWLTPGLMTKLPFDIEGHDHP